VPNAALRFTPRPGEIAPDARQRSHEGASRRAREGGEKRALVWIEEGRFVRPLPITVGLTNGVFTEVEGKGLIEGLRVAVGESGPQPGTGQTNEDNPSQPRMPSRANRSGQGLEAGQAGASAGAGG